MSRKKAEKMQTTKRKFEVHKYTVILFDEEEEAGKLFECIPDIWFVDELREQCFFPPKTGRPYIQRAINCEKPDDSWGIYNCKIVSGGFLTYNAGFKLVKEKCAQRYNTSSAEEKIQADNYRREHPALIGKNIEHIFSKPKSTQNTTVSDSAEKTIVNANAFVEESATTGDESVISENAAVVLNNSNSNETSSSNYKGNDAMNNDNEIGLPAKAKKRKIEQLKLSVQPSQHRRSSSHLSSGKQQQRNSSSPSSLRRRKPRLSHSQQTNNSVVSSRPGRQSSGDQRSSSSGSSDQRYSSSARQVSSRLISQNQHHANSRSNSLQTSHSSRGQSNRSSSRSPPMRNSRSRSNSINRRSTFSRSNRPAMRNSHSRSRIVLSSDSSRSSHRRSRQLDRHDRSGSVQPRSNQSKRLVPNGLQNNVKKATSNVNDVTEASAVHNHQSSDVKYLMESSRSNSIRRRSTFSRSNSPAMRNSRSRSRIVLSSDSSRSSHRRSRQRSRQLDRHNRSGSVHLRSNQSKRLVPKGLQNNVKKATSNVNDVTEASAVHNHQSSDVKHLMESVKELTKSVKRNNDLLAKNERRLTRLEVTVNKIFITVGDMNGNNRFQGENDVDPEDSFPDLPIERKRELYKIHKQLKDKEFRKIWLDHERNFCCPTKTSTDTVTMTKYLKRFVSLEVRCQLTLKEPGESKLTLYKDYHRVYLFLLDVIKEGYRICGKRITVDEAHTALRVVWGRSKQLQNNTEKK